MTDPSSLLPSKCSMQTRHVEADGASIDSNLATILDPRLIIRHALISKGPLDQLIERHLTAHPKAAARPHRTLADAEAMQFTFSSSMEFLR